MCVLVCSCFLIWNCEVVVVVLSFLSVWYLSQASLISSFYEYIKWKAPFKKLYDYPKYEGNYSRLTSFTWLQINTRRGCRLCFCLVILGLGTKHEFHQVSQLSLIAVKFCDNFYDLNLMYNSNF